MSDSLYAVWKEVETLIDNGFSVIPIRDKSDERGDEKSPYREWQKYQTQKITKPELWQVMSDHNTTAIAIVCGKISNNLWVLDIDSKHKPGIDALIFADIKAFYPELWDKLRVHQSKHKGYHLPVFLDHDVPRSRKLAARTNTDDEKRAWADKKGKDIKFAPKTTAFLETRGEGGLISWPPSVGYKVVKDVPIPTLTEAERLQIENVCISYDEVLVVEKEYKPSKTQSDYYDVDPFIDYNERVGEEKLMSDHGWNLVRHNSRFLLFSKPGAKGKDVHAGFDRQKRLFRFFTTETETEVDKSMRPSTLLGVWDFNNDKQKLYRYLVDNGYGKVKPAIEAKIIKRAATNKKPLQPNFSEEAKANYDAIIEQIGQQHPFGIFWETDDEDKVVISRERLHTIADNLGFRLYRESIVQIIDKFIYDRDKRFFVEALKSYINEDDADIYEDICNAYETFMQHNGKYTIERLPMLDETLFVRDTRSSCNKFYQNGFLTITSTGNTFSPYTDLNQLVFFSRIQQRQYNPGKGGVYLDFLEKACELSKRERYIKSIIGFLSHEYKDESTAFIIILTEQVQDPKDGGGSGKNIFCNLLKNTTTYISKAGAQAKFDEKFFQIWNGQKIFAISDAPEHFDFLFLKEPSSGDFVQKKLFQNEYTVPASEAPKFIIQTNYSYEVSDGGLRRRMHAIEFTDYFTKVGGVDREYGFLFPLGWSEMDWAGYDNFIADCVQTWLFGGLKIEHNELTETGWQKQFEHTYGITAANFIREHWEMWKREKWVSNEIFKLHLERYYNENNVAKVYQPSMIKINNAVKEWIEKHGWNLLKDHQKWDGVTNVKGRLFVEPCPF